MCIRDRLCPTYRIERSTNGSTWTLATARTTTTTWQFYNLDPTTTYYFRVNATNDNGTGPWAQTSATSVSTTPDAPANLVSCSLGGGSDGYRITWNAPVFDGGSPITNYKVNWDHSSLASSQETTVSGLLSHVIWAPSDTTVWVYAVNVRGRSERSESILIGSSSPCP